VVIDSAWSDNRRVSICCLASSSANSSAGRCNRIRKARKSSVGSYDEALTHGPSISSVSSPLSNVYFLHNPFEHSLADAANCYSKDKNSQRSKMANQIGVLRSPHRVLSSENNRSCAHNKRKKEKSTNNLHSMIQQHFDANAFLCSTLASGTLAFERDASAKEANGAATSVFCRRQPRDVYSNACIDFLIWFVA